VTREIRIYVEGGGDGRHTKQAMRRGFSEFLGPLRKEARKHKIRWSVTACGSNESTLGDFSRALTSSPHAVNVLLVDSEGPVSTTPWEHLRRMTPWSIPSLPDTQCHLMVQMMESWFLADVDAVEEYYGQGFQRNAIPKRPDVEAIDKEQVLQSLERAARATKKKTYHKIHDGSRLLECVDPDRVRSRSRHCDRLFVEVGKLIDTR